MGFLGFGKKKGIVDLTEHYRKEQEKAAEIKQDSETSGNVFSLFDKSGSESGTSEAPIELGLDDRKKKLVKRLAEMTTKLEELSNQIYHLQQRIEVLERKAGVGNY